MLTRFRESLVNPSRIIGFRKDRVWLALLYMLFFAALLTTRTSIDLITFDGMGSSTRALFETEMSDIDTDCRVIDAELVCDTAQKTTIYSNSLIGYYLDSYETINPDLYDGSYNVVIHDDAVKFVIGGAVLEAGGMKLSELPEDLQNLDFSMIQSDQDDAFFDAFFGGIDEYLVSQKGIFVPVIILVEILGNFLLFLFFVLFSSWFMKMRFRPIPFKEIFVMTIYSSTALYLVLIFDSLFSLSFFLVILLIFVAFRQNNALSREIYLRLKQAEKRSKEER